MTQNTPQRSFKRKCFLAVFFAALLPILSQCEEKTSQQYVKVGLELMRDGDFPGSMEAFLHAIEKDNKNAQAYYGLGGIYNVRKAYDQAVEVFQTAVKLDPTFMDAYYSLGYSFEMLGNKDEAKKNYDRYHSLKGKFDKLLEKERAKS